MQVDSVDDSLENMKRVLQGMKKSAEVKKGLFPIHFQADTVEVASASSHPFFVYAITPPIRPFTVLLHIAKRPWKLTVTKNN